MHTRFAPFVFSLVGITLMLAPQAASAAIIRVNIVDDQFIAKTIDINPGDTVQWVNTGAQNHTVTADNGSFDSGAFAPQAQYSQTFSQPGSYPYYDKSWGGVGGQGMSGLIRVIGTPLTPVPQTGVATPVSAASLLAQIAQLQQLIASIKGTSVSGGATAANGGTLVPTSGVTGNCPQIGRPLQVGASGNDVRSLQQFLFSQGLLSADSQTGYYGALTQAAVQQWQIAHGIVSSGTPATTGFGTVGPRTAAAMALQCSAASSTSGGSSTAGGSSTNGATVGGFIQVSPISGDAPLTVSVVATVNTVNSCAQALYLLDWGDGSQQQPIPVSFNTCQQLQQTYTHTYTYGGSYAVTLSAGGSSQSATVSVNGPARPNGVSGSPATLLISSPVGGQNFSLGNQMNITWQSGATVPAGSQTVFDLYTGAGQKVNPNDVIAITSYTAGTIPWTIPGVSGSQTCPAIYPSGLCGTSIPTGSYKIHATVYAPSTQSNTFGAVVTQADSGVFTLIASGGTGVNTNYTYNPLVVVPASSGNPLSATATFDIGNACELYNISWGDGQADSNANTGQTTGACSTPVTKSITHTYTGSGAYTVTLQRGASLSHVDSIGYTISN